jgi:hypothetical protein
LNKFKSICRKEIFFTSIVESLFKALCIRYQHSERNIIYINKILNDNSQFKNLSCLKDFIILMTTVDNFNNIESYNERAITSLGIDSSSLSKMRHLCVDELFIPLYNKYLQNGGEIEVLKSMVKKFILECCRYNDVDVKSLILEFLEYISQNVFKQLLFNCFSNSNLFIFINQYIDKTPEYIDELKRKFFETRYIIGCKFSLASFTLIFKDIKDTLTLNDYNLLVSNIIYNELFGKDKAEIIKYILKNCNLSLIERNLFFKKYCLIYIAQNKQIPNMKVMRDYKGLLTFLEKQITFWYEYDNTLLYKNLQCVRNLYSDKYPPGLCQDLKRMFTLCNESFCKF